MATRTTIASGVIGVALLGGLIVLLAPRAMAQSPAPRTVKKTGAAPELTQADLDRMTDACGVPRTWLKLEPTDVFINAEPDADMAKLECIFERLYPVIGNRNFAFLGNAQASEKK